MARIETVSFGGRTLTFEIPEFIHEFGDDTTHTFEGSLRRHLAVEKVLIRLRGWLIEHDALPGYSFLDAFLDFLFGLNCNFPLKDIILHMIWTLKDGYYPCIKENQRK